MYVLRFRLSKCTCSPQRENIERGHTLFAVVLLGSNLTSTSPSYDSGFLAPLLVSSLCVEGIKLIYLKLAYASSQDGRGWTHLDDSIKSVGLFQYNVLSMVPNNVKITYFWPIYVPL